MNAGDVVLLRVPQIGGRPAKLRPALVLCSLPGAYQGVLICGISTQVTQLEADWDEVIDSADPTFINTGLHRTSACRLSYLYAADVSEIAGSIGTVDAKLLKLLRARLVAHLQNPAT